MTYTFVQKDLTKTITDMRLCKAYLNKLMRKVEDRDVSGLDDGFSQDVRTALECVSDLNNQLSTLYFERYGEKI